MEIHNRPFKEKLNFPANRAVHPLHQKQPFGQAKQTSNLPQPPRAHHSHHNSFGMASKPQKGAFHTVCTSSDGGFPKIAQKKTEKENGAMLPMSNNFVGSSHNPMWKPVLKKQASNSQTNSARCPDEAQEEPKNLQARGIPPRRLYGTQANSLTRAGSTNGSANGSRLIKPSSMDRPAEKRQDFSSTLMIQKSKASLGSKNNSQLSNKHRLGAFNTIGEDKNQDEQVPLPLIDSRSPQPLNLGHNNSVNVQSHNHSSKLQPMHGPRQNSGPRAMPQRSNMSGIPPLSYPASTKFSTSNVLPFSRKQQSTILSRVDSNPIGPQKTKSQIQANQKKPSDESQEVQFIDEESPLSDDGPQSKQGKEQGAIGKDKLHATVRSPKAKSLLTKIRPQQSVEEVFRERIAGWKTKQMENMTLSDKLDFRNPQVVADCAQSIYENMLSVENANMVDPQYLQKVQKEIKDTSRAFLIEWLIDVHRKFRLVPEALYVTQHIIDQFLSRKEIKKSQLHLLGVATLLIASKYEEIYPPDVRDFIIVSENKFSKRQVLDMEKEILLTLEFKVTAPSAYRFLERYRRLSVVLNDDEVFFFAQYLLEVSLLDASLLRFKPSQLAAASMILSAKQLKKTSAWTKEMEKYTKYTETSLEEAVAEVRCFAVEINPKFISTLKYKFSKPNFHNVARHPFKF